MATTTTMTWTSAGPCGCCGPIRCPQCFAPSSPPSSVWVTISGSSDPTRLPDGSYELTYVAPEPFQPETCFWARRDEYPAVPPFIVGEIRVLAFVLQHNPGGWAYNPGVVWEWDFAYRYDRNGASDFQYDRWGMDFDCGGPVIAEGTGSWHHVEHAPGGDVVTYPYGPAAGMTVTVTL